MGEAGKASLPKCYEIETIELYVQRCSNLVENAGEEVEEMR